MADPNKFPSAQSHGSITQLFDNVFFVTGSFAMKGKVPLRFSSNMTVIRENGELTLINTVRLSEAGLAELDKLGEVKHVIRLAGFHGSHDPFYQHRYQAKVWSVDAPYVSGLDKASIDKKPYFLADEILSRQSQLPIRDSQFILIDSARPQEGLLLLQREQGILVAGDCLQNWASTNQYFNWVAKVMMRLMGFIKPFAVGPAWLKNANPEHSQLIELLDLNFEHVLPAHGDPVIGNARKYYQQAIKQLDESPADSDFKSR